MNRPTHHPTRARLRAAVEKATAVASLLFALVTLTGHWTPRGVALVVGGSAAGVGIALLLATLVRRLFRPLPQATAAAVDDDCTTPAGDHDRSRGD